MRRLVWIHAGRKSIMLILSWRGSFRVTPLDKLGVNKQCWKIISSCVNYISKKVSLLLVMLLSIFYIKQVKMSGNTFFL
jgi:hypothetical protein